MYIHRIILRGVRVFSDLDITLFDPWMEQPLRTALISGANGTGKTTLLRVISALWENFGLWLELRRALNTEQMAHRDLLVGADLAAIEIRELHTVPVWLFVASSHEILRKLKLEIGDETAQFIGEIRGTRGRPVLETTADDTWLSQLRESSQRLKLQGQTDSLLPNMLLLEAEKRDILTPPRRNLREQQIEPFYRWHVTYEARDRWDGHIETMLANLKLRDVSQFAHLLEQLNTFFGTEEKRLTDFDDNLRLQVRIGRGRRRTIHYIEDLSAGERQCLIILFMISRWLMPGGVVLIDEPDLHLHVSLQRHFIHTLETVIQSRNGQMIITSHSPVVWEEFHERQRRELRQGEYANA